MPVAPTDAALLWTINVFRTTDGRYVAAFHDAHNFHMGIGQYADTMGEAVDFCYTLINEYEADNRHGR